MQKAEPKILSLALSLAAAALLALGGGLPAQEAGQEKKPEQEQTPAAANRAPEPSPAAAPAARTKPQVTGTVLRWTGDRIDLKTPDGKTEKVAVNRDTEKQTEIKPGAEVTVEYRRKISGFVIAERVLPARKDAAAAAGAAAATAPTVTGKVVSWNDAALVLKTDAGEVTLFLSPATQYKVKSLDAGLAVTVEYQQVSEQARMATLVRAAGEAGAAEPR